MTPVLLSPAAIRDVDEIGDYIASDNPVAAVKFIQTIRKRCAALSTQPRSGRARPELRNDLRSVPFDSYVIFYSIGEYDLRIERILHGARDIDTIFDQRGN